MTSMSRAGRKRSDKARHAILDATLALLNEKGFAGLAVEAVAARAGVGKATIYRWWKSRAALAMEAFMEGVHDEISFPHTASACDDLRVQINKVFTLYQGEAGHILCEVIALGQGDPEVLAILEEGYLDVRREQAREILERAVRQQEIRPDIDKDVVIEALYSPIFCKMLMRIKNFTEAYINAHVDLVFQAIRY